MENGFENIIQLPTMAMRGVVVFPNMTTSFDVGRPKSIKALEVAMENEQNIFLVTQRDVTIDEPTACDLYEIGTIAEIKQIVKLPNNSLRVLIKGVCRARLLKTVSEAPYFVGETEKIYENGELSSENEALLRQLSEVFREYFSLNSKLGPDAMMKIETKVNAAEKADAIASGIILDYTYKQQILDAVDAFERVTRLIPILKKEIEIIRLERSISEQVQFNIDKHQREYYLREQLKVISDELGDKEGINAEIAEYQKKLDSLKLSEEITEKLSREIQRMAHFSSNSQDGALLKNYLDTVLELPWNTSTKERFDINKAEVVLNAEHYGLEKVKERILEYLSVRKLAKKMPSPILCLVGPPGVGKTSIVKSIAKSVNRNYVRISLGGVRDEADIRGHRKTYIGAMPGRIINALKQAKSNNPVLLFDEIDKMGNDFRGDPSSAMLEVLDAEQNFAFRDHYIEVPFDLSKAMFITTANTLDTIPPALRDRMEIIKISGYTSEEKLEIAKRHLVPKQLKNHGLNDSNTVIDEGGISAVIEYYTREAGVRSLERELARICRKAAKLIVEDKSKKILVTASNIEEYLGKKKFMFDTVDGEDEIGIVRGLAWTSVGGDTLSVEVNTMPGTGKLELTGQLGDVMKESARTAISYVRSRSKELEIDSNFYRTLDVHIHVPEGAVPKDGPSAGITMATALISALTGRQAYSSVAMTGEITLRGKVLPIGGLKEKSLAAYRAGVKTVIIPYENKRDLDEISDTVKEAIKFVAVKTMDEVLDIALSKAKKPGFSLNMAKEILTMPQNADISQIKQ